MSADERLVVMLEARISEFEKRMAKAERTGTGAYRKLRSGSSSATRAMEQDMLRSSSRINQGLASISSNIGTFGKAFAAGAITAGLAKVTTELRGTIREIAQIGDEAKRAGLAVEAFQEWGYVARQNRIGIDALTDGFKELNLRADEFVVTGKGSAAEAFTRLGFTANDLKQKLKDPSALMLEIIGRLEGLDKAAQIRIADEIFGGTGSERFVELLGQGEDKLRATIQAGRDLGAVMDAEAVAKADQLDRKFGEITERLQGLGKAIAVGLAENAGLIDDIDELLGSEAFAKGTLGGLREVLAENGAALEEAKEDVEDVRHVYEALQSDVLAATRVIGGEIPTILEVGTDEATALALELSDVTGEMEALIAQVISGAKPADVLEGEMAELARRAKEALEEANRIDGLNLDHAIGAVDGLSTALATALGWASSLVDKIGEIAGVPAAGGEAGVSRNPFDLGGEPMTSSPRPQRPGVDSLGDWQDANTPKTSGRGGGGRGDNRLDALVESLRTEREILEEWYQESLDLLNNATEAQLEALGGKHEAIERLEREHKERMAAIQDASNAMTLEGVLGAGADILGAMAAHSQKALKISQAFAAAEALVSTYKGAAKELEKGTFGFASAAAVIAKGMAFIGAIRSARGDGGGSAGRSAAAAPAAAPAASPQKVANYQITGTHVGQQTLDSLFGMINQGIKDGYTIHNVEWMG